MSGYYSFATEIPLAVPASAEQEAAVAALEELLGHRHDVIMEELEDGAWLTVSMPEQELSRTEIGDIDDAIMEVAVFATDGFVVRYTWNDAMEAEFHGPSREAAARAKRAWGLAQAQATLDEADIALPLERALALIGRLAARDPAGIPADLVAEARSILGLDAPAMTDAG